MNASHIQQLTAVCEQEHTRLVRIAAYYLPRGLAAKVSAEDVVQEACLAAYRSADRIPDLTVSVFVWLRSLVQQCVIQQQRRFQSAAMRDVGRECPVERPLDAESSFRLLQAVASNHSTPSTRAVKKESAELVSQALLQLSDNDREILRLKFFEDLRTGEIAEVLSVQPPSVTARVARALTHFETVLQRLLSDPEAIV